MILFFIKAIVLDYNIPGAKWTLSRVDLANGMMLDLFFAPFAHLCWLCVQLRQPLKNLPGFARNQVN